MGIKIFLNGREEIVNDKITILDFLNNRNIRPDMVSIELNKKIIKRKDFGKFVLNEGDKIEIIYFIGGG